jgi:predicted ATPase
LFGAIAWSYQLLTPPEQHLFRRLSVFADGCASDAIAAAMGSGSTDTWLLPQLAPTQLEALVEKHLVCQTIQAGEAHSGISG